MRLDSFCNRFSRSGGQDLLQCLESCWVSIARRDCSSRLLLSTFHEGRASADLAVDAPIAPITALSSLAGTLLQCRRCTSGGRGNQRCSSSQSSWSRTFSTITPRAQAPSAEADAGPSESTGADQRPPSSQQLPSSQQHPPAARQAYGSAQDQRPPSSAAPSSGGPEQRSYAPPRQGYAGPPRFGPPLEGGFQGRSRQLVNLKQRQVGPLLTSSALQICPC